MFLTATRRLVATTSQRHLITPRPSPTLFKIGSSFSTQVDPAKMGAAKDFVEKEIKAHDVVVFSKSYCPVSRCHRPEQGPEQAWSPRRLWRWRSLLLWPVFASLG